MSSAGIRLNKFKTTKGFKFSYGKEGRAERELQKEGKALGQSRYDAQLWMCLVVKVKSDAAKDNIASRPGMLGP